MRFWGICYFWLASCAGLFAQSSGIKAEVQQVYVTTNQMAFDIYVQAVGPNKEYLGFCDFVFALPPGSLTSNAEVAYQEGSLQLITAEQQLAVRYPLTYVTRVYQRAEGALLYIGIDPPRFREANEFVAWVAEVDQQAGKHRIGRFVLTGLAMAPDSLQFHFADKGLRTQCYNFRPAERFAARATPITVKGAFLPGQWLEQFDAQLLEGTVQLSWQSGEAFAWKSLQVERSYDGELWEEIAFTPASVRKITDRPSPPALLEGRPLVFYRLRVGAGRDKMYESAWRLIQF